MKGMSQRLNVILVIQPNNMRKIMHQETDPQTRGVCLTANAVTQLHGT